MTDAATSEAVACRRCETEPVLEDAFCRACGARLADPASRSPAGPFGPRDLGPAATERAPRPGTRFLAASLFYFLLLLGLLNIGRLFRSDLEALVAAQAAHLLAGLAFMAAFRKDIAPSLGRAGTTGTHLVYAAAIGIIGFVLVFFWILVLTRFLGARFPSATALYEESGRSLAFMICDMALVPALLEEFLFRGILFGILGRVAGRRETVAVTALAFAFLHLSATNVPHLLALGVLYGYLRQATGSVYPGMVAHFVHNSLVVVFERCFGLA